MTLSRAFFTILIVCRFIGLMARFLKTKQNLLENVVGYSTKINFYIKIVVVVTLPIIVAGRHITNRLVGRNAKLRVGNKPISNG